MIVTTIAHEAHSDDLKGIQGISPEDQSPLTIIFYSTFSQDAVVLALRGDDLASYSLI